jgi:hypothetical protein
MSISATSSGVDRSGIFIIATGFEMIEMAVW